MNIKKYCSRVYGAIKDANYIMFLVVYVVICSIIGILFEVLNTLFINSDILVRFELGLPLILQLILTYIVYRKNHHIRIIKFLFIAAFFYTLVCGMLAIYDLYFTYPSFADNLFFYVSNAQIVFQFVLSLLLICLIVKQVDKLVIAKPLLMVAFTVTIMLMAQFGNKVINGNLDFWIMIILLINIFNPVLLYILSYTAKGKLFIKGDH